MRSSVCKQKAESPLTATWMWSLLCASLCRDLTLLTVLQNASDTKLNQSRLLIALHFIFYTWRLCLWSLVLDIHQLSACTGNKWLCHCREEIVCGKKHAQSYRHCTLTRFAKEKAACKATVKNSHEVYLTHRNAPTLTRQPPDPTWAREGWSSRGKQDTASSARLQNPCQ